MLFASSVVLALAVASVSAHSIHHVRRHHAPREQPPVGWATGYLESYDAYHTRYLAVGCEDKHNTTFFDLCCHPLLATETLEKNRAPCCAPGSTAQCPSSSSSAATPASTSTDDDEDCDDTEAPSSTPTAGGVGDDDDDCDDEDGGEDASSTVTSVKGASSTPAAGVDDGDDEDCEDDDSSAAQGSKTVDHATKAATSTHAVVAPASTHSSPEAAPTATHTTPKTTTTAKKASPTSTADKSAKPTSSTSSPLITGGFGTWFTQNGVAGACGTVHKDTDLVVALPTAAYNNGANCGRKIRVFKADDDNTFVDALVADECPTCDNKECVDMSVAAFETLASLSVGEFPIKYEFLD